MSRKELAERAAIHGAEFSETAIRRAEDAKRPIRASELFALSQVFDVEVSNLMLVDMTGQHPIVQAAARLKETEQHLEENLHTLSSTIPQLAEAVHDLEEAVVAFAEANHLIAEAPPAGMTGLKLPNGRISLPNNHVERVLDLLETVQPIEEAAMDLYTDNNAVFVHYSWHSFSAEALKLMGGGSN
ncbi:hypothetical protein HMPREF2657_02395 [Corynebacterium sp. HMSC072B08]|nr:hypothetical protein HMPREF2657_02395 [Corynebacterium sp. HMSC072B08]OHR39129.1 hypothetical protein HMPREF3011_01390 [Corynebacterium sp. HMSC074C04]